MNIRVKQEVLETVSAQRRKLNDVVPAHPVSVIELSSSSSDSEENSNAGTAISGEVPEGRVSKKRKLNDVDFLLAPDDPARLDSDTAVEEVPVLLGQREQAANKSLSTSVLCKKFWKTGEYDGGPSADWDLSSGGMDHVRVHPKFLHSNATSHKWALGAFAELLDNSLDEVCNGATHVNVDMLKSIKDMNQMLLIEDNGGGMDPDKMRQCMSLGYSAKTKVANTIGQCI
ncbi:MORC family CW-type zinc finger protein 4, putative isoform 3 [Hibiscus syriacus]|uniref:MORC family CW-type zinc finger protein 4, putative isoform 3 n=1 Tax=Hibiscus syriacus TaxID=106335 RepID=A0A6A2YC13_HIBSY|nr:MORC family CW-type zinc finger protein 4, putative isoform 3 [Hibiscus syriacus]